MPAHGAVTGLRYPAGRDCPLVDLRLCGAFLRSVDVHLVVRPGLAPDLVSKSVQHGLPEVRLQRACMARLEDAHTLERLEQAVLDKIVRISQVAGPQGRRPRESLERPEMAGEQPFGSLLIAIAGTLEELDR